MAPTAWENSAMPILNYSKIFAEKLKLNYRTQNNQS
jgi:hypothetical protein